MVQQAPKHWSSICKGRSLATRIARMKGLVLTHKSKVDHLASYWILIYHHFSLEVWQLESGNHCIQPGGPEPGQGVWKILFSKGASFSECALEGWIGPRFFIKRILEWEFEMETHKLADNLVASPSIQMDSAFAARAWAWLCKIETVEVATKTNSCLKSWPVDACWLEF